MVTKMTAKHQITIPRKILGEAGFSNCGDEEMYFDIKVEDGRILLSPVKVIIEERIPDQQWQKFETHAAKVEKGDEVFSSSR